MPLSGIWEGYWDQLVYGRQPMRDLQIHFSKGEISGGGKDIIGLFQFSGEYDSSGKVLLLKQYVGKHQVIYQGQYDGEGRIFGIWNIGDFWKGEFAITLKRSSISPDAPIHDL